MFALPPASSPLREAFDVAELVRIGQRDFVPPSLPEARQLAREFYERSKGAPLQPKRIFYFVLRADDGVELVSIGPRGGWKSEWRFGQL